ncbi:MAG: 16S rRNA (uracil(1498)-N(3))-methyltransferase [Kiritimatiellae bacterium]|nr:16S rRNA (uracil(1498)-N(3))-methyltransferase [Kiritimatiellia bacterium]
MHRCLVQTETVLSNAGELDRERAHHLLNVLRVRDGDVVEFFDGCGHTRKMTVRPFAKRGLGFSAAEPAVAVARPSVALTLFACVSKGKRMDWTVEKAVELSVSRIVPVLSERTVVKIAPEECAQKAERWMRVAEDAARQCDAAWLPEILPPVGFQEAVEMLPTAAPVFFGALLPKVRLFRDGLRPWLDCPPKQAGWFVGPEGDFSPDEMDRLIAAGAEPVGLGDRILRTETACIYGLCVLNSCFL